MSSHPSTASTGQGPVPAVVERSLYAIAGLAALVGAVVLIGPWAFALWLVPDLALVAAYQRGFAEHGRLAPRAVPLYNALHSLAGPILVTIAGVGVASPLVAGLGVLWLSHVTLDRAMGYGLRTPEGEQRV